MRTSAFSLLLLMLGLCCSQAGVAQQVPSAGNSPDQAVVAVADTSDDTRNKALAIALVRVLSRTMGSPLDAAQAAQVARHAEAYVRSYTYRNAPAGAPQPYQLVASFDPVLLKQLAQSLAPADMQETELAGAESIAAPLQAAPMPANSVWISGIGSALDFAAALHALDNIPGITRIELDMARGNGLLVRLQTNEPWASVLGEVENSGHFSPGPRLNGAIDGLHWSP